jgi:bifunctional non-homologous end joining protein LigD
MTETQFAMGLQAYHHKRNFKKTAEPRGRQTAIAAGSRYVIQKHAASRLHFDFRLELDGVLLSWAVPKGPSYDPHEKRLAVHVEDHPVEYADFEGTIPAGQYGGGTVMLWDAGTWEALGDPHAMLKAGALKFRLAGRRLRGAWTLVRMKARNGSAEAKENWLLIKERDDQVRAQADYDVTHAELLSVASGRTMEEIAAAGDRVWRGAGPSAPAESEPQPPAPTARLPRKFACELATLVDAPPAGDDWLHEIKYDGYRMLCRIENNHARMISRNGKDWSAKFPTLTAAAEKLGLDDVMLDGEVVVLTPAGISKFSDIPDVLQGRSQARLTYFVFYLPFCDGKNLTRLPLTARKACLEQIIKMAGDEIRYSEHIVGQGAAVYADACRLGLEGIICKRAESSYVSARTRDWVKVKCAQRQEFVIGGWSEPGGARVGFGALLLGYYEGATLHFAGRVGTGFNDALLKTLQRRLAKLEVKAPPFTDPPHGAAARGVHWVRPQLVCEVSFTEWLAGHAPRHPAFEGLRADKAPRTVGREQPKRMPSAKQPLKAGTQRKILDSLVRPMKAAAPSPGRQRKPLTANTKSAGATQYAGVNLTRPDRVLYPLQGITKRQLAEYFAAVQEWILPQLAGRPLSLVRCPRGAGEKCFFQKHLGDTMPPTLRGIEIKEKEEPEIYILVDDAAGLISLAQLGVLELHPWGSTEKKLEQPDRIVMDLDPDEGLPWAAVVTAARELRETLADIGLESWVKTSGGKGLHVVVPLVPKAGWEDVKTFARALAEQLARQSPSQYVSTMSKAKRRGKIFVDYLRNSRGATSVAAYSPRARGGAPVSAPVDWDELGPKLRADAFTLETMPARLAKLKHDPWEKLAGRRQTLTAPMRRKLGL